METPGRTLPVEQRHPKSLEPVTAVITIAMAVVGGFIGIHMITTLGVSPNTSVIGALVAMLIGRLNAFGLHRMRDVHRQNLVQTSISSATFAAANSLLTPIAIPFAFGRTDLVWPTLLGASLGLTIDVWVLYHSFGSQFLPATSAWPPGVAAAETIQAGDKGGRRALILLGSGIASVVVSFFGLPMSAAGVAMIGNTAALFLFGVGLMIGQYAPGILDVSLSSLFIPHGLMIGAGLVALIQAGFIMANKHPLSRLRRRGKAPETTTARQDTAEADGVDAFEASETPGDPSTVATVSSARLRRSFITGYILFVLGAVVTATVTGLVVDLSVPALIGWVLFAAFAAIVHEVIVGVAAMQAGWFPSFAVTLIFLVIGLVIHMPQVPLLVLVGYCASTGPAFADMGYDLKAGWLLRRGEPNWKAFELEGRRQQLIAGTMWFAVAIGMVALLWHTFFSQGQLPPTAKVFADTIKAGLTDPSVTHNLILWAIPGAILQLLGGTKRQLGVMFATGLLVATANACWMVFAALAFRWWWRRRRGTEGESESSLVGAGFIAGDSLYAVGRIF